METFCVVYIKAELSNSENSYFPLHADCCFNQKNFSKEGKDSSAELISVNMLVKKNHQLLR